MGVSHWLGLSPLQQVSTTVLPVMCDVFFRILLMFMHIRLICALIKFTYLLTYLQCSSIAIIVNHLCRLYTVLIVWKNWGWIPPFQTVRGVPYHVAFNVMSVSVSSELSQPWYHQRAPRCPHVPGYAVKRGSIEHMAMVAGTEQANRARDEARRFVDIRWYGRSHDANNEKWTGA